MFDSLTATIIHHQIDTAVEVAGIGPRGGPRLWVVHLDRRGVVRSAFQHEPPRGFLEPKQTPAEVRESALAAYRAAFG